MPPAFASNGQEQQIQAVLPAPVVVDSPPRRDMEAQVVAQAPSSLPPPMPTVSGLICPLCHEQLEDPVLAVDGHTYCRRCIQDWFQQTQPGSKPKSPATGQPLLSLLLFPNLALSKALASIRNNMQPAWVQAEQDRQALRMELDNKTRELVQAKANANSRDYSKDLNDAELQIAGLTVKLHLSEEETRHSRGEVQRLNKEMTGMTEKLERMQAQIAGERSALQQIEELDSALRLSTAEVTRVQTELEAIKKQETALRKGKAKYETDISKATQESQKMQEELVRLRSQLQFRESIPSSAVLAEELDAARQDIAAKDIQIRDLQLAGTRTGAQLVEATEKQRQVELQMRRVPEVEAENHQLRSELTQIVSELAAVKETLVKTEEKLRLREAAAPELAAAELLATEAERLEEELADAYAKCATVQAEVKKREDLLRGIPLVLADFLEQIHLPDPVLSSSHAPEDAPRLVIASLQRLQTEVQKREQELKAANEKIAELCEYGAKRDEDVQQEAYDALRAELWDVTQRCAKAEAELEQLGTARERGGGSLIKKMAMLMYNLEVSILSGSGLRDSKWRPGGDGLQCVVDVIGKDEEFQTSSNSTARNPVWNHTGELQMSHSDTLRFAVMGPTKLGEALLPASRIVAAGFEGELTLSEDALLKVKVTVKGSFLLEEGAVRTKAAAKGAAVKAEEAAGPAAGPEAASKAAAKAAGTAAAAKAAAAKGAAAKGAAKAKPSSSSSSLGSIGTSTSSSRSRSRSEASSKGTSSDESVKAIKARKTSLKGTPLVEAAKVGDLQKLSALLARGDEGLKEALHGACAEGQEQAVQALLKAKAQVNSRDGSGLTPLHVAAFRGDQQVVRVLCSAKADVKAVDEEGWTPLYVVAAFGGQADVARVLLTAKSDVSFKTSKGTTVAMAAKQKGFNELLKLLNA